MAFSSYKPPFGRNPLDWEHPRETMMLACSAPRPHSKPPDRGGVAAHPYSENTRRGVCRGFRRGKAMSAKRSISNSKLQLEDVEAIKILKARYGYFRAFALIR